jgi:hypothetical protein
VTIFYIDVAIKVYKDFERDIKGARATDAINGYL